MRIELTIDGRRVHIRATEPEVAIGLLHMITGVLGARGIDEGLRLIGTAATETARTFPGLKVRVEVEHEATPLPHEA